MEPFEERERETSSRRRVTQQQTSRTVVSIRFRGIIATLRTSMHGVRRVNE